ncbi:uncharacterized protein B0H64DRAFT_326955 [Chaetomium fimeti]|uniref:Zinc finger H2C2-type histone UAS binding domain-containing protein n=1 Tax=Chaetomium fimeti TaxID=1854472 RepID=A0AAE0HCC2_9PEZI|nr:hypothetical protein B0H64DRAFT_326955 [Chaetomium fimeti]
MLKDKEVISDPQRQYEIARSVHNQAHGGINKTTATIAERYHWSRIKETVSDVIRNCSECKDTNKASSSQGQQSFPGAPLNGLKRPNLDGATSTACKRASPGPSGPGAGMQFTGVQRSMADPTHLSPFTFSSHLQFADPSAISILPPHPLPPPTDTAMAGHDTIGRDTHNPMLQSLHSDHHPQPTHPVSLRTLAPNPHSHAVSDYQPIDPQIIAQSSAGTDLHHHAHHHHHTHGHYPFSPPSPPTHHAPAHHHDPDTDADAADVETFQALINAAVTDDDDDDDDNNNNNANDANNHNANNHVPTTSRLTTTEISRGVDTVSTKPGHDAPTALISPTHHHHPHAPPHTHANHPPHDPRGTSHDHARTTQEEQDERDEQAAVDRDLEMLIESPADDDEDGDGNGDGDGDGDGDEPMVMAMSVRHGQGQGHVQEGGCESPRGGLGGDVDMDGDVVSLGKHAAVSGGRVDVVGLLADGGVTRGGVDGMGDGDT